MTRAVVDVQVTGRKRTLPAALDPHLLAADIPPNVLVHLVELAARRGLPHQAWFSGLALSRQQISDPGVRVSYRQARTFLTRALRSLREPALGLLIGRQETLGSFGLLGLAMMTARNFGEAVQVRIANHKICGSLLDVELLPVDDRPAKCGGGRHRTRLQRLA